MAISGYFPVMSQSLSLQCYALSGQSNLMMKSAYAGTDCVSGSGTANFFNWKFTGTARINLPINALNLGTLFPAIRAPVLRLLATVTCNGVSILDPPVPPFRLSRTLKIIVHWWGGIGIAFCLACIVFVTLMKKHPIIRAASFPFLIMIACGYVLMYVAAILYANDAPSTAHCEGVLACLCLGFSLVIGPLFAKNYRIYLVCVRPRQANDTLW
jgi:hypothetical protein